MTAAAMALIIGGCASSSGAVAEEPRASATSGEETASEGASESVATSASSAPAAACEPYAVTDAAGDAVAAARFASVEPDVDAFEHFAIEPGSRGRVGAEARRIAESYEPIIWARQPRWTIAALVQQGRVYEILAGAIRNAPIWLPAPGEGHVYPAPARPERERVEARVREALEPETRVIECFGIYRYVLANRAGRAACLDDEHTRTAAARLRTFSAERITECVELMRRGDREHGISADPTIPPYVPGELGPELPLPSANLEPLAEPRVTPLGD